MRLAKQIGLACVFVALASAQQVARKPIVPLRPPELIKYLPAAPPDWTMSESAAKNFFVGWICAQATREFQHPAAAVRNAGEKALSYVTRIRLMDTGYFPSFNGDFDNFRVGKYSNAESVMISGMPARRITVSPARERLRISVRGRFIVEVETDNQPANAAQTWLRLIDFATIARIPDSAVSQLPKPITIETVDELHPANNNTSQLHWGGSAAGTEP